MICKRKIAFSLTVAVSLALLATTAGTAAAQQGMLTSDGPVTLTTEETAQGGPLTLTATPTGTESLNALTAFGSKLQCSGSVYTGHKYNVTPHEFVISGATRVTVTPHYGKCTIFGKPATVDMNGCDYVLDFEGTTGTDKFAVKTTIVCPSEKHINVTIFESEAQHTEKESFCMLTVTENVAGYTGLSATDTTNGRIDISGTAKSMTIHETSEGALCAEATTESGELHLDVEVEGKEESGATKGITISDEGKLTWGESASSSNATTMFAGVARCPGSVFTGHKYNVTPHQPIPIGSTNITLTPHYKNCSWRPDIFPIDFPVTVDMNGCDYRLEIGGTSDGEEGTYDARTDVVCPLGQEIRMTIFFNATKHAENKPFCRLDIAQQSLLGLHATHTEDGHIDITGTLKGMNIQRTNVEATPLCPDKTTTTQGEYDFDLTVDGQNSEEAPTTIALSD